MSFKFANALELSFSEMPAMLSSRKCQTTHLNSLLLNTQDQPAIAVSPVNSLLPRIITE